MKNRCVHKCVVLSVVLLAAIALACSPRSQGKPLREQAELLRVGMTEAQVIEVLGQPDSRGGSAPKAFSMEFVQSDDMTKRLMVQFTDGKTVRWHYTSLEDSMKPEG